MYSGATVEWTSNGNGLPAAGSTLTIDPVMATFTTCPYSNERTYSMGADIVKLATTLTYNGPTAVVNGQPVTLSGTLTVSYNSSALPGESVTFTLGTGLGAQSCTGTTDILGAASCTISSVSQPVGSAPITVNFAGDSYYLPSSDNSTSATVFYLNGIGAFVVGDRSATSPTTVGSSVYFWGSHWATNNLLSGQSAKVPSAMKGFANNPIDLSVTTPAFCGGTWTTTTGNSSSPPPSIPSPMYVIVSSHVTQTGSAISGTIEHIVLVTVNPGYGPDPGHAGTGTVIATIC